jgi:hypothetical protein
LLCRRSQALTLLEALSLPSPEAAMSDAPEDFAALLARARRQDADALAALVQGY